MEYCLFTGLALVDGNQLRSDFYLFRASSAVGKSSVKQKRSSNLHAANIDFTCGLT